MPDIEEDCNEKINGQLNQRNVGEVRNCDTQYTLFVVTL